MGAPHGSSGPAVNNCSALQSRALARARVEWATRLVAVITGTGIMDLIPATNG